MTNLKNLKFIDLFAGIGGFHLGLHSLEADCVYANEWEKNAQEVYFENFGLLPDNDITQVSEKNIPRHDILCAGFPCQAFSVSGKRLGFEDTRGTLFFDVARIISHHHPKVVFLENVKNFFNHDSGKTYAVVKQTLENLGYDVYSKILRSSDFGVPQARERLYIVCFKKEMGIKFDFPKPLEKTISVSSILEKKVSEEFFIQREDIDIYKSESDVKNLRSPAQIGKINKGGQGERIYSIHSVGPTISANGGGAAAKTGAYLVNERIRKLTPKECLRMQGFPEEFQMNVPKNIAYKLLGNSVSVPVIEEIAKSIAYALAHSTK